nr:hypothetical protein [uncultured Oscillibacter sp.]
MSIEKLEAKELQEEFVHYLQTHYTYAHPGVMASEVMHAYRHNIGMPFEQIFSSNQAMDEARKLLIDYFEKIGRKDPKRHAAVHYGNWLKFKEFLDFTGKTL